MVKLNLLPAKVRSAELLRLAVLLGMVVYLALFGLLAWRFAVAKQALAAVKIKIDKVEGELKPLQAIADEVKKLSAEKNEQEAKKSKLSELTRRQVYLVRAMDLLPDLMQGGQIWLSTFDQETGKGIRRIVLEGKAVSPAAWADFYDSLDTQALIGDLKIDSPMASSNDAGRIVYTFKVSFVLKDPS